MSGIIEDAYSLNALESLAKKAPSTNSLIVFGVLSPLTDKISEIKRSFLTERSAGNAILMSKLVFSNNHTFRALAKEQYENAKKVRR